MRPERDLPAAAVWRDKAIAELENAVAHSPDDAKDQRSLAEVKAR